MQLGHFIRVQYIMYASLSAAGEAHRVRDVYNEAFNTRLQPSGLRYFRELA